MRALKAFKLWPFLVLLQLGCRSLSPTPSPSHYQEEVMEFVRESHELKEKGSYFSPHPRDRKKTLERTLKALLNRAESEMRFVGVVGHPEALKNSRDFLSLAQTLITSPTQIKDYDVNNNCENLYEMSRDIRHMWKDMGPPGCIILTTILSPVLAPGLIFGAVADLLGGWQVDLQQPQEFTIDPQLIERFHKLQIELQKPKQLAAKNQSLPGLVVSMTYVVEGDPRQLEKWRELSQKKYIPGDKKTSGIFSDSIKNFYYQKLWIQFNVELRELLRERQGHLKASWPQVKWLGQKSLREGVFVARVGAHVPVKIAQFVQEVRAKSLPDEGVYFDVELTPPTIEAEERGLHESLERAWEDK